jgi:uncharacterized protein YcbK (DUF882 family)
MIGPRRWDAIDDYLPAQRRRRCWASALLLALLAPGVALGATAQPGERQLAFYHTHTGERLQVVYRRGEDYLDDALKRVDRFLGDFRTGDVKPIDPATLDIIYELRELAGYGGEVHIISAYRSPVTNEMLRQSGRGVARKSQHLEGRAIDIRFPGVDTAQLRDLAKSMRRGGVGYYRDSDFIHVDSGRVRYW